MQNGPEHNKIFDGGCILAQNAVKYSLTYTKSSPSSLRLTGRPVSIQPLRRFAPAPLVGEPLAKRWGFTICQGLPSVGEAASHSDDGEVRPCEELNYDFSH